MGVLRTPAGASLALLSLLLSPLRVRAADCHSLCAERVGVTWVAPNGNLLVQGPVPTTAFCKDSPSCTVDYDGLESAIEEAIQRQIQIGPGASGLSLQAYDALRAIRQQGAFNLSGYQLASHVNLNAADDTEVGALEAEWEFFGVSSANANRTAALCQGSVYNPCGNFMHPSFSSPGGDDDADSTHNATVGLSHWYPYNGCPGANCSDLPGRPWNVSVVDWSFPSGANFSDCVEDIWRLLHPLPSVSVGKRVVYMHCGGGTDRTGSLALGFRLQHLNQTLAEAYNSLLQTTRASIPPNAANKALVQWWCEHEFVASSSVVPAAEVQRLCSWPAPGPPAPTPLPNSGVAVYTVVLAVLLPLAAIGAAVVFFRSRRRTSAGCRFLRSDWGMHGPGTSYARTREPSEVEATMYLDADKEQIRTPLTADT